MIRSDGCPVFFPDCFCPLIDKHSNLRFIAQFLRLVASHV
jgi:hypothetical protein